MGEPTKHETSSYAGRIRQEWYITCGRCETGQYIGAPGIKPSDEAHAQGWLLTRRDGWVCPDCQRKDAGQ